MDETIGFQLRFEELDEMDALGWEAFYEGVLVGLGIMGAVAAAT